MIGTASERNHEYLHELGADEVINYRAVRFEEAVSDVRRRIRHNRRRNPGSAPGKYSSVEGSCVSIFNPPSQKTAAAHGVRQAFVFMQPDAAELTEIAKLADAGKLKTVVETVLPLEEAHRAQDMSQGGHSRGKIVLKVL